MNTQAKITKIMKESDLETVHAACEGLRVGTKVPVNLYRRDQIIGQCQTPEDARAIVAIARLALAMLVDPQCDNGAPCTAYPWHRCSIHTALAKCAREIGGLKG